MLFQVLQFILNCFFLLTIINGVDYCFIVSWRLIDLVKFSTTIINIVLSTLLIISWSLVERFVTMDSALLGIRSALKVLFSIATTFFSWLYGFGLLVGSFRYRFICSKWLINSLVLYFDLSIYRLVVTSNYLVLEALVWKCFDLLRL